MTIRASEATLPNNNQSTLLDLTGVSKTPYWVDPKQDLFLPNEPLHWEAHKLQVLLDRLEKSLDRTSSNFNTAGYMSVLEKYTSICKEIITGKTDNGEKRLDEGNMAQSGDGSSTQTMGTGNASSVGTGVSTDNPLAR